MACGVLNAFKDKRFIPKWNQFCYDIPHRAGMSNDKGPYIAKKIQGGLYRLSKPLFCLPEPLKGLKIHLLALKALILTYQASKRLST